jgi:hypothetical protein
MKGQHVAGTNTVSVADGLSDDEAACVLAHEISHAIQHPPSASYAAPTAAERQHAERVAHGSASLILHSLGGPDYEAIATRAGYRDFVPFGRLESSELTEARQVADIVVRAATMYRAGWP